MTQQPDLNQLSADQLRVLAAKLMASLAAKDRALTHSTALNDKLTHELAILKRHKYARRSEQLNTAQEQGSRTTEVFFVKYLIQGFIAKQ